MFDYDVSTLKDFTFNSIYDVFALIAKKLSSTIKI